MEEKELVSRAKGGCADALGEIVERYQQPLFSFLYRYVGQRADAEDLCQEVFVRAIRHIDGFRSESRLGTWLFTIAANLARDWQRKQRRRRAAGEPIPVDCIADAPARDGEKAESIRAVRSAVGSLPPRERTAVILRMYHELSYEKIARVMGCSTAAVGPLLCRARKRLASQLSHLTE